MFKPGTSSLLTNIYLMIRPLFFSIFLMLLVPIISQIQVTFLVRLVFVTFKVSKERMKFEKKIYLCC